jgi:hypothetical protein
MRIRFLVRPAEPPQRAASKWLTLASTLAVLVGGVGCLTYPDSDKRLSEEIVVTHYNPDAKFDSYKTFAISPEVIIFSEDDGELDKEPMDEAQGNQLIDQVVKNMKDRGYTQVDKADDPDLAITVSGLKGTVIGYYSSYWGGYWGYPYYPYYYYPYYYSYSYNTGTVLVDAVDLNAAPPSRGDAGDAGADGKVNVSWVGFVYGVLSSSKSENTADALNGIDQAFEQSPYFRSE